MTAAADCKSVLACEGLRKTYQGPGGAQEVIAGVDMTVDAGERICILGPSGAGKTTLLYILAGLDQPSAGRVSFAGHDYGSLGDAALARIRREHFGFIFQSYNLVPSMTAQQNVELPLRLKGGRAATERARELLNLVGLAGKGKHLPGQLSGGEQQRVAIARALVTSPSVIFADEPTGNLDERTGGDVMDLISRLAADAGAACLLVTHNRGWIDLCDRALALHDGRLVVA